MYRSERADRELPVGARFFDFVGGAVDRARAAGAVAVVVGDFNVAGLESTDPAWPRAPGRLGSATTELSRMHAWIDDRGLTVVSGAGCSPAEAVTRRSGDHASEIDYVVVDAGRGVDVVSCATDGDDDGPLVDMYGGGPYTTDHRAIYTRLRVRVLEARREAAVPRRRVRWGFFLRGVLLFYIDAAAGRGSSTWTLPFVLSRSLAGERPLRRAPSASHSWS